MISYSQYAENLAAGTGDYSIASATGDWASEACASHRTHYLIGHEIYAFRYVAQYNPANPVFSHFTQMVWKATTQVGCAVQSCGGIFPSSYGVSPNFFYCGDDNGDLVCRTRSTTYVNTTPLGMLRGSLREFSSFYYPLQYVLIRPIARTFRPEVWRFDFIRNLYAVSLLSLDIYIRMYQITTVNLNP